MTTIWLARHAETAVPAVFHGAESDVGLSDLGRRQAAAAADWFRHFTPSAVVSSAMLRARDTAAPIAAACGVPHTIEVELHERRIGPMSGTAYSFDTGPWPETIRRWTAGDLTYSTLGAESFADLRDRAVPAFDRVTERFRGGRVVLISHGVVCKVLLLSLLPGYTPADWERLGRVANLAVTELRATSEGWAAARLLEVPPPVAEITAAATGGPRSEASSGPIRESGVDLNRNPHPHSGLNGRNG
jgi:broad specificity phosphatase PhoE